VSHPGDNGNKRGSGPSNSSRKRHVCVVEGGLLQKRKKGSKEGGCIWNSGGEYVRDVRDGSKSFVATDGCQRASREGGE